MKPLSRGITTHCGCQHSIHSHEYAQQRTGPEVADEYICIVEKAFPRTTMRLRLTNRFTFHQSLSYSGAAP
jgi:hypothetical protein